AYPAPRVATAAGGACLVQIGLREHEGHREVLVLPREGPDHVEPSVGSAAPENATWRGRRTHARHEERVLERRERERGPGGEHKTGAHQLVRVEGTRESAHGLPRGADERLDRDRGAGERGCRGEGE